MYFVAWHTDQVSCILDAQRKSAIYQRTKINENGKNNFWMGALLLKISSIKDSDIYLYRSRENNIYP